MMSNLILWNPVSPAEELQSLGVGVAVLLTVSLISIGSILLIVRAARKRTLRPNGKRPDENNTQPKEDSHDTL